MSENASDYPGSSGVQHGAITSKMITLKGLVIKTGMKYCEQVLHKAWPCVYSIVDLRNGLRCQHVDIAQSASNAENISIWWHHHEYIWKFHGIRNKD